MFEIIPSPGTEDKYFNTIEEKIKSVSTLAKTIHIDVIDGKFAKNTTFLDPKPFSKFSKDLILEVHLMVEEPINYLKPFAEAGFRRFIGQIEKMSDQVEFVAQGQLLGEVGLAIDLGTPSDYINVPLSDLDCVLVMSVQAGFSGQDFNEESMIKVRELREKTDIPIEVDGGISDRTIHIARNTGATRFVATSALFGKTVNPHRQFQLLEKILQNNNF